LATSASAEVRVLPISVTISTASSSRSASSRSAAALIQPARCSKEVLRIATFAAAARSSSASISSSECGSKDFTSSPVDGLMVWLVMA
jgi:hypothetical protein